MYIDKIGYESSNKINDSIINEMEDTTFDKNKILISKKKKFIKKIFDFENINDNFDIKIEKNQQKKSCCNLKEENCCIF